MEGLMEIMADLKSDAPAAEPVQTETPQVTENPVPVAQPTDAPANDNNEVIQLSDTEIQDTPASSGTTTVTDTEPDFFQKEFGKTKDEVLSEYKQLQQLKEKGTYKTDFARTFDELYSKGVPAETITQFGALDISKLDDRAALDFKMKIEHPELTNEEREAVLNRKYPTQDDMLSDSEKVATQAMMKIDAAQARKELEKVRGEKLQPLNLEQKRAEEFELQETKRKAEWTPKIKEVVESVKKFEFPVQFSEHGQDGKAKKYQMNVAYQMTDSDLKTLEQTVNDFVSNFSVPNDAEGIQMAKTMAINAFKANNFERMVSLAASKIASRLNEQQIMKTHNPKSPQHTPATGGADIEGIDARYEATLNNL